MTSPLDDGFCPYRGLAHYDEDYAAFFVGREGDVDVVVANLYAAPLTLLYGESGVGKTSVLMAGVVPRLRATPGVAAAVFREWQRPDFAAALDAEVRRAVREAAPDAPGLAAGLPFDELLAEGARALGGPVFLVFDQFEEYFLYHREEAGSTGFEAELARAVNRRAVDANFLVCLREEGLSRLDRFQARIPNLMGNTVRLERLDRATASRAVTEPLARYTGLREAAGKRGMEIEPELVESLLSEQVSFEHGGAGGDEALAAGAARDGGAPRIELPFLQLVLTRLWAAEREAGSPVLRRATLQRMGGANGVVRAHLGAAMARFTAGQRRVAAEMFHYLVTPSRTKIAHTAGDLAKMMEASPRAAGEIAAVVDALSGQDARILKRIEPLAAGGEDRFEIFHDALAPGVLDWRGRFLADRRLVRRVVQVAGAFALLALVLSGVNAYRQGEHRKEERRTTGAHSEQLAAAALGQLVSDPTQARALAGDALRAAPTERARDAWYRAWLADRLIRADTVHRYAVRSVAFSGNGALLLSACQDDSAKVWPAAGGPQVRMAGHTGWVNRAVFAPGDSLVATASEDRTARIWSARGELRRALPVGGSVTDVAFTRDGRWMAVVTRGGMRSVWNPASGARVATANPGSGQVLAVDVAPNGMAASGTMDGVVELWSVPSGQHVRWIDRGGTSVFKVRFSPDGTRLAVVGDGRAQVYPVDREEPQPLLTLKGHTNTVFDVAWSRDGRYLATASRDRTVRVWDAETGASLLVLHGHDDWAYGVAFDPGGPRLASASGDGRVRLWRIGHLPVRIVAPGTGAAADREGGGRSLVVESGAARVRGGQGGRAIPLHIASDTVAAASFTPDGRWVVAAGKRGFALWAAEGGAVQRSEPYHLPNRAPGVFLSPDRRWLVAAREDGGVEVYDLRGAPQPPSADRP